MLHSRTVVIIHVLLNLADSLADGRLIAGHFHNLVEVGHHHTVKRTQVGVHHLIVH